MNIALPASVLVIVLSAIRVLLPGRRARLEARTIGLTGLALGAMTLAMELGR